MKKNKILLITIFIFLFCFSTRVEALCTTKRYNTLKAIAYQATPSYELKFDEKNNHYFQITVNNVDKDILVKFNGFTYEPKDGVVEITNRVSGGITYEIKLLGGYDTYCVEEQLYTKNITLPKYNPYSERDECIEYEEFELCNKWYSGYIANEEEFLNRLNSYILSLSEEEKEEIQQKGKSFFEKVIDLYVNNLVFTLPITIIILIFIVYRVVVKMIRRKNRIKLNS